MAKKRRGCRRDHVPTPSRNVPPIPFNHTAAGHVALPGCRTDGGDTDDIRTALKEAGEEFGLPSGLSSFFIF